MGLFDIFKKKEEEATPEEQVQAAPEKCNELTVRFSNSGPFPFCDPDYGSMFVNYTAEITVSPKDRDADLAGCEDIVKMKAETALNNALSATGFSYKKYTENIPAVTEKLLAFLSDYNVKSLSLLSFEPDESFRKMIEAQEELKRMQNDPEYAAAKMKEMEELAKKYATQDTKPE